MSIRAIVTGRFGTMVRHGVRTDISKVPMRQRVLDLYLVKPDQRAD
jgi:hypothetical protein